MTSNDAAVATPVPSKIPHRLSTRSPRSSLDSSPRTPSSPFLHNLSNRFRKGSNASNLTNGSESQPQASSPTERVETAQSAKRFVLSVARNDWEWPPPQPHTVSGGENTTEVENKQESTPAQREPVGWRTRFEAASDLDLDLSPVSSSGKKKSKRNSDPYKFESPDAIASVIQEQRTKRKRANIEETVWNEGLRAWTERRDAWTAAQPRLPKKRSFSGSEGHLQNSPGQRAQHKTSRSSEESKHSRSTQASATLGVHSANESSSHRLSTAIDTISPTDAAEEDDLRGPYLPIYPPLFPTSHTLRARIKPAAYPTIYSKVVVQSLTPNVPVPLTHMIGALVDGWKAEGNWPPQTIAEQQTHALLKRAKGSVKAETAFQKWRRERDLERSNHNEIFIDGFTEEFIDDDEEQRKKGFRRSISGAVKKVLGIHPEVDEDGGLAKLGLSFGTDHQHAEDGMMKESKNVTEDNVMLNKQLLEGGKG